MARSLLLTTPVTITGHRMRARARGFTLVELAVVVVIVGVLSVVAVVGYRKIILSGKVSEATNVIGAIRIAQEDFKSEKGGYQNINNGTGNFCPQDSATAPNGKIKTQWSTTCPTSGTTWGTLAVHIADPLYFGYKTSAGVGGTPGKYGFPGTPFTTAAGPWFTAYAEADLDGDGVNTSKFLTSSGTNRVFSDMPGE